MHHLNRRRGSTRVSASSTCVEALERRVMLTSYMVTNHRDLGPGSLRDAVQQSNANPGPNTITFAITGTITLSGTQLEISNDLNIVGPGASSLSIDGGGLSRVFLIDAGIAVTMSGLTVTGGRAPDGAVGANGGGIYSLGALTLNHDVISGNTCGNGAPGVPGGETGNPPVVYGGSPGGAGGSGGGIYSMGSLNIADSTITDNSGGAGGTGAPETAITSPTTGGDGGSGGGIFAPTGNVVIVDSTISDNHSGDHGALGGHPGFAEWPFPGGSGAGIAASGQLELINCTVSGNILGSGPPVSSSHGGISGASGLDSGPIHMISCTISANNGEGSTGGSVTVRAVATVSDSIISGNIGGGTDVAGTLDPSSSYDVIGSGGGLANGVNGNFIGANAPLSQLGSYGGPTQTMLPLPGNFAIGDGSIALAVGPDGMPLTNDQRGLPRTSNGTIDIGAAEVGPPTIPLVVATTKDQLDPDWGPNNLSLREAIGFASTVSGPQVISFLPGLSGTIALSAALGPLQLSHTSGPVTIDGPGASVLSVQGGTLSNSGIQVEIDSLGLANVSNSGTMTLSRCAAADITNTGTLTATDCTATGLNLDDNSTITNCTISGSDGTDQVRAAGVLRNCTIHGVKVLNLDTNLAQPPTFINCTITGPVATAGPFGLIENFGGCALTLVDCTVGNSQGTAVWNGGGAVTLIRCTLNGSSAPNDDGGAMLNEGPATLNSCIISGNSSSSGGGIFNDVSGNLSMTNCTISGNSSIGSSSANGGGGIENLGTLTLSGCTLSGNTCTPAAVQSAEAVGGGIDNSGTASLFNCTISGNSVAVANAASAFVTGGGIQNSGTLQLTNCTVAGNTANAGVVAEDDAAGGGIYSTAGHVFLNNNVVARNTTVDPHGLFSPDVGGTVDSSGAYNLIGVGDGMTGLFTANHNQIGTTASPVDPKLGPLADNGGPTMTIALLPGSPAIDAGSNALALGPDGNPLATDQRGFYRIFNGTVDIGAFESGSSVLLPAVSSFKINNGSIQRSMVTVLSIQFNIPVTLGPDAVTLTIDSVPVPFTMSSTDQENYLLRFNGSVGDGTYVVIIHAASVSDSFGQVMAADQTYSFFRLFGDYDGDGTVNNADYLQFKKSYGSSTGTPSFNPIFDYDGNGIIDSADYMQFKKRYGKVFNLSMV